MISVRESRRIEWHLLVGKLAELMRRPSESHGMLLSEIAEHSRKKKKAKLAQKVYSED